MYIRHFKAELEISMLRTTFAHLQHQKFNSIEIKYISFNRCFKRDGMFRKGVYQNLCFRKNRILFVHRQLPVDLTSDLRD